MERREGERERAKKNKRTSILNNVPLKPGKKKITFFCFFVYVYIFRFRSASFELGRRKESFR
jgi:hypothetical protein